MNETLDTFAAVLQEHRNAYLQVLPARLAQLDALARGLAETTQDGAPLGDLERLAHSLAGSAGTFGFSALGETARALELAIGEGGGEARRLAAGAAALRAELQRVLHAGGPELLQ